MSYRRVLPLVEGRHYADSARCIEYGPLAACFNPRAEMEPALRDLFLGCGQIVSFLHDPDGLFRASLEKIGVKHLLTASPLLGAESHAAYQLATPLASLALFLDDPTARIFLRQDDHDSAAEILSDLPEAFFAIHPGSGSLRKNWPVDRWEKVISELLHRFGDGGLAVLIGEADEDARTMVAHFQGRLKILNNLPLNTLVAVLSRAKGFLGHDSGMSHLAAAVGVPCLLLFGPTDPTVWAPAGPHVRVLQAPGGDLSRLEPADVLDALPQGPV